MTDETAGGNWAVKETRREVDGELATILLGVTEETAASLPGTWLRETYDVVDLGREEEADDALAGAFDLLVLDEPTLSDLDRDAVRERTAADVPLVLPVLLVTPDPGSLDDDTLDLVDDVLAVPTDRRVLDARVESLLRTRRLSVELDGQNERLEAFASAASHDLRNPLNIASGRLELLVTQYDDTHLDKAAEYIDHMETLIEDILSMARNGTTVTEVGPVHFRTVVGAAWGRVDTETATLEQDGTDVQLLADKPRLQPMVEQLLDNAVEHGGDDVTVRVVGHDDGFSVEDDGPGIPEDDRETVFEGGYTTADDGTGFGLNVVESIATAHGWTVDVGESDAGGARITIGNVDRPEE